MKERHRRDGAGVKEKEGKEDRWRAEKKKNCDPLHDALTIYLLLNSRNCVVRHPRVLVGNTATTPPVTAT